MELANIEKLLEKYLNAETSIAEEKTLKKYFSSNQIAPHLVEYQTLFSYFTTSKSEKFTKTLQLKSKKRNWKWISVAATTLLIVSVYAGYQKNQEYRAEKLYTETRDALGLLSANLNKGSNAIGQLQHFETTTNKVFKQPKSEKK